MIKVERAFNFNALEQFNRAFVEATELPRFADKELVVQIEMYQDSLIYTSSSSHVGQLRAGTEGCVVLSCTKASNAESTKITIYTLYLAQLLERQDYIIHFVNFLLDGTFPPTKD
jgi:hypothetical protein